MSTKKLQIVTPIVTSVNGQTGDVTLNISGGGTGNMKKLTFTGAVTGEYDGTADVSVDIPSDVYAISINGTDDTFDGDFDELVNAIKSNKILVIPDNRDIIIIHETRFNFDDSNNIKEVLLFCMMENNLCGCIIDRNTKKFTTHQFEIPTFDSSTLSQNSGSVYWDKDACKYIIKELQNSGTGTLQKLTFTGAVTGEYDGSEAVTIDIPNGGGTEVSVQSDWNQNDETASDYIKNRPFFATDDVQNITWDGDTTNKIKYGDLYYHISDLICDKNDFIGAIVTKDDAETITIATVKELDTTNDGQATKNLLSFYESNGSEILYVLYCLKDNTVYNNITFSKSGIYFLCADVNGSKFYASKLTFPKVIGKQYKTLDSRYLPIATASTAGTIKVGNGLSISADGTLSVTTATYYTGTSDPVNTLGADGDLYLKTEG